MRVSWSGWGPMVPLCALAGVVGGTLVATAVSGALHLSENATLGLGEMLGAPIAAFAVHRTAVWVEAKPPHTLVNPKTQERFTVERDVGSFFGIPTRGWIVLLPLVLIGFGLMEMLGGGS